MQVQAVSRGPWDGHTGQGEGQGATEEPRGRWAGAGRRPRSILLAVEWLQRPWRSRLAAGRLMCQPAPLISVKHILPARHLRSRPQVSLS